MSYILHLLIFICIYSMLGVSLNLLAGYTGLLSICHAAFYGLGAYVTALLILDLKLPWTLSVIAAAAFVGFLAWATGRIALRFRGDVFVIFTFALQVIIYGLFLNWTSLTQGPMGIAGIPAPSIGRWHVSSHWQFLVLATALAALVLVITSRIVNSPFGRCLKGIREDELYVSSLGKDTSKFKTSAFIIAAVLAALAGSFYAGYVTFVDPSSFSVAESISILAIVIIGGPGSLWGPVAGAAVLVLLPELLRFLGLPDSLAANARQALYGLLLVGVVMWYPKGLLGEYSLYEEEIHR